MPCDVVPIAMELRLHTVFGPALRRCGRSQSALFEIAWLSEMGCTITIAP